MKGFSTGVRKRYEDKTLGNKIEEESVVNEDKKFLYPNNTVT